MNFFLVKLIGKYGILDDKQRPPVSSGRMKKCWKGGKKEVKRFVCLLAYFVLLSFVGGGAVGVRGTMGGRGDKQN